MFRSLFPKKAATVALMLALLVAQVGAQAPPASSSSALPAQAEPDQAAEPLAVSPNWSRETIDPSTGAGLYSSATINSEDMIVVAYSQNTAGTWSLRLATGGTGSWNTSSVDGRSSVGTHNAIALDGTGSPHLAYYDVTNSALKYARRDGSAWATETVDNAADVGAYSSLAVDDGGPHISYYDATNADLKYAGWDGSRWSIATVDGRGSVGTHTSLAMRASAPRIGYYSATDNSVLYASRSRDGWQVAKVNAPGAGGEFVSMVMDTNGYERLAYSKSGEGVRFAVRTYSGWSDRPVVMERGASIPTALALDGHNVPHIAYVAGDGTLRHATHTGAAWVVATVDDSGDVGTQSLSIVLDSAGLPHILYHSTSGGLKHAYFIPLPDLVVTDIWPRDGQIWFQACNTGKSTAAARHDVELRIDTALVGTLEIPAQLAPGERYSAAIAPWSCSGRQDTIRVTADVNREIAEGDEYNNWREEVWLCDTTPPTLLTRPTATELHTDSATIRWTTDEPSDSRVYYGSAGGEYSAKPHDATRVTEHALKLTGLRPATLYRFMVESADAEGNRVSSREAFFETAAPAAEQPSATLTFRRASEQYAIYELSLTVDQVAAQAGTWRGIDSVRFYYKPETRIEPLLVGTANTKNPDVATETYNYWFNPWGLGLSYHELQKPAQVTAVIVAPDLTEFVVSHDVPAPGYDERPIDAFIIAPGPGQVYYLDAQGNLPPGTLFYFAAEAMEYAQACTWEYRWSHGGLVEVPNCRDEARPPAQVKFYRDGNLMGTFSDPIAGTFQYELHYGSPLAVGAHTFRVVVTASDDPTNTMQLEQVFYVEATQPEPIGPAPLEMQRTVTRNGSHFDVQLAITLSPAATHPVHLQYLYDYVREFMPANKSTTWYTVAVEKYPLAAHSAAHTTRVKVDFGAGLGYKTVLPGETWTVSYKAVPILYEDGAFDPMIGDRATRLYYWKQNTPQLADFEQGWTGNAQVRDALRSSDYIIVTNPTRLLTFSGDQEALYALYGTMATLATLRNGVFGFLDTPDDTSVLDHLLEPGHYWSDSLHPAFSEQNKEYNDAYVLIVGENWAVPAFDTYNYDLCWDWEFWEGGCVDDEPNDVLQHDQWYASTSSPGGTPELNLGRIIGNNASLLRIPIETSIYEALGMANYQVPGSAIVYVDPSESYFTEDADEIVDRMNDHGWNSFRLKLPDSAPWNLVSTTIDDGYSVVHLRGHGGPGSWSDSALSVNKPVSYGGFSPLIFAATCLTGDYRGNNDVSLAERMLQWGAGGYIGSLQVSPGAQNRVASKRFYSLWSPGSGEPAGRAFGELERDRYQSSAWGMEDDWRRFWITEYQYYGDPRYGASGAYAAPASTRHASAPVLPDGTLHVQVPAYQVATTAAGLDEVTIPGGDLLLANWLPQVPYWTETVTYPAGHRVRDVTLTSRGGYAPATGLHLPVTVPQQDSQPWGDASRAVALAVEDDEWVPGLDEIYSWEVTENPDGSSSLHIDIAPFHYQPATTNVEWYDDFVFEIDVIQNEAAIERLALDKGSYDPSDLLSADLWLDNPGAAEDLVVMATIRSTVSEQTVADGLELAALHDTEGPGHYRLEWDTVGFAPGYYTLVVELKDGEGSLLHSAGRTFQLGAGWAAVTAFSASPTLFKPGDAIDIAMTVQNTGAVPISGEAIIRIESVAGGALIETYMQAVTDLAPGATASMSAIWDTSAATEEAYRISGFLSYEGKATEPATVVVGTQPSRYYLPLVLRNYR
jgi:hypothetical protein